MEAIKCKEITFTYPNTEQPAVKGISFIINKGDFCLLMGESAAGKSTLLKLLKKEIAPFGALNGEMEINGSVGYVSQKAEESIVCDKVRSELSFGLTNAGLAADNIELLVSEIATYFHLESKLDEAIKNLSGGEKQLVNLAAVMVMKPDILLLDEPCAQLDPIAGERFVHMVKKLHRDFGVTVLMSEHRNELMYGDCSRILVLDKGTLVYNGDKINTYQYLKENGYPIAGEVPFQWKTEDGQWTRDYPPVACDKECLKAVGKAKDVWFAYEKGKDVLKGLDLTVYGGRINAVIGANGCGKSTLLKVMAGVKKAYRGKVKHSGTISMLTQNVFDLFTKDTCAEEVRFGAITDSLGIEEIRTRHPYDISGGQAQRLALAKVLERGADIILLDEPTQGFDCVLKEKLGALLQDLCRQGKTIVMASHDLDFVGDWSDYCSFLSGGSIIATKETDAFFEDLSFYTTSRVKAKRINK